MDRALPFGQWIHAAAARSGDALALRAVDGAFGYAALARHIDAMGAALAAAGVERGAVVAWLGTNSAAMIAMLFATARRGAVFMPLNWRLAPPEHRAQLAAVAPRLLVVDAEFAAACVEQQVAPPGTRCVARGDAVPADWTGWGAFVERGAADGARSQAVAEAGAADDEPVLLCYTSGSTGAPKGALLSGRALAANADAAVQMHGLTPDDRVLTTLPLFHVGGLNIQTLPALRLGCAVTLHAKFDPEAALDAIARERITLTVLVPAQLEALLAHPRWPAADLSSLRVIATGSTVVPRRLIDAVHARGVPLIQVWGATETGPVVCCQHADEARSHAGSAGRAALHAELRIADVDDHELPRGASGEVLVRGPQLMSGYFGDAPASARALAGGWFHSGDAGHLDADGFLWIDGRLKDMIISGGENVSPVEVEAVLLECADIAEAAVVGRPDARWGEAVVAFVVPKAGARIDRARVLASFAGRLARFKHPREVIAIDALPRTAIGKVRKDALRQLAAAQEGQAA
ncbi:MAG: AMP-binding protein [Burkholderiaceae bacterium]|nr:AMP-binding protein [Burkholderiaceae bacterium]